MIRIQNTEERFLYYSGRTGLYRVDTEKDKHLPFKFTNKKRFGGEGLSPDTGGGDLRFAFTFNGQPFTFGSQSFTYGAP